MHRFDQLAPRDQAPLPGEPYDRWLSGDGDVTLLFYRTDAGFLLRFIDMADFVITAADRSVTCIPVPGMAGDMIVDLHFNQVVPLLMTYEGELVLHASAVRLDGGVIAFLGRSGRGKSTLAAAFARAGHPFLTDDGLVLEAAGQGYMVRPRRPLLRLHADSRKALARLVDPAHPEARPAKRRVLATEDLPHEEACLPLRAIYVLPEPQDAAQVTIASLTTVAALSELLAHSFVLDVDDRVRVKAHFERLAELAVCAPCFTLDYPRRYGDLPKVLAGIADHARQA